MNRLSKIFLIIIIILIIALSVMTYLYFDMRGKAIEYRDYVISNAKELYKETVKKEIKSIEDPEERRLEINRRIENGEITQEIVNELYILEGYNLSEY